MTRVLTLALLIAAGTAAPATAQYYGDGGYGGGGYGRGGYGGGYDRDYGRRGYDDPPARNRRGYDPYGGSPRRFSTTCATARGSCPIRPVPQNTPCGCEIPGFGYKRGAAY